MQNKKYFCYEIYKNLAVWSHNGKLSYNPCSFFSGYIKSADTFNLNEVWNGPEHAYLKHCVENDIPIKGCQGCYNAEQHGLKSRRTGAKEFYESYICDTNLNQPAPQSLDYSVGNLCNLKCVICGPQNSSAWVADYRAIYPLEDISASKYNKFNQLEISDPSLLSNLKNIHFHGGGDPLLSENHINLLKQIKEIKGLKDLHVHYNINGTKKVSKELLDLWAECQLVELYFSIDDVGQRFEYQRTGASWQEVTENISWFKENMPPNHMFKINCTWSLLNIYYLNELVDWWNLNLYTNRLGDHVDLIFQKAGGITEVTHLSSATKQIIFNKYLEYPQLQELINSITESELHHRNFIDYIMKLDSVRGINYTTLCNDFFLLLNR